MSEILHKGSPERISREHLRSETAALLHDAFRGVVKMVAAELDLSTSRIYRQTEGQDANWLELLVRQLARAEREGNRRAVVEVLAWLAGRFGFSLCAQLPAAGALRLKTAASSALRESTDAVATALESLADETLSPAERRRIAVEAREGARALENLALVAEHDETTTA